MLVAKQKGTMDTAWGLLYFFPNPAFSPYLVAGVGWHFQDIEFQTGTDRSNQFGKQAGAGFDIPLGTRATPGRSG